MTVRFFLHAAENGKTYATAAHGAGHGAAQQATHSVVSEVASELHRLIGIGSGSVRWSLTSAVAGGRIA